MRSVQADCPLSSNYGQGDLPNLGKHQTRCLNRWNLPNKSHVLTLTNLNKMRNITFFLVISLISSINALHFYLDANQKRCFIEELPTDTVVEGVLF